MFENKDFFIKIRTTLKVKTKTFFKAKFFRSEVSRLVLSDRDLLCSIYEIGARMALHHWQPMHCLLNNKINQHSIDG